MDVLNLYTNFLRKQYFRNFKNFLLTLSAITVGFVIIAVIVDTFLSFDVWFNILRAFIIAFTATAMFSLGYTVSFFFSQSKRQIDQNYVMVKDRFSPTWRRRISVVIGAAIFGILYSIEKNSLYSTVSSFVVAVIIAVIIFLSMSEEEQDREFYGVPDARDLSYEKNLEKVKSERVKKAEERKRKKVKGKTDEKVDEKK